MTQTAAPATPVTTFEGLWEEVKTSALNVIENLKAEFQSFEKQAVPVIEADVVGILGQLKGVATQVAGTLATQAFNNMTGSQKQAITIQSIMATAVALGKPVVQQDAVMLAQQAYHGTQAAIATLAANAGK